ncbi:MAG: 7-carboxy-7-deazaguanine synthase QueE [Armatimonadetes bacterium]|nr:7-carboxy-7-deazaguanine synthase QueE [Armatimonadota bacterium]
MSIHSDPNLRQNKSVRLVEMFSSVQGEGPLIGYRQIFLRLFGCNIRCDYCDTPDSLENLAPCRIESPPGSRQFACRPNPVPAGELLDILSEMNRQTRHHSLSVTGGEPLLQADFLKSFLPFVRAEKLLIYLETNGLLPDRLAHIIDLIDIVGMDIKIASSAGIPEDTADIHRRFLEISAARRVFVKIVVAGPTTEYEIRSAADLIAGVSAAIPLVLQPLTPFGRARDTASPEQLLRLQSAALERLEDVRVIPQMHKTMNVL